MSTQQFDDDGFTTHKHILPVSLRPAVEHAFSMLHEDGVGSRAGLTHPAIASLARAGSVRALVEPSLGRSAFAFRATLFDKTEANNWPVAWHQDRVVPVAERLDADGFTNWSQKPDGLYVEPPRSVLERCVAIRIDLDGSGPGNGGLQLCAGSHRRGVLTPDEIEEAVGQGHEPCPKVVSGGALRMRPLLLHRSGRSMAAGHRRIVHIEFCATELRGGLRFAQHVMPASE